MKNYKKKGAIIILGIMLLGFGGNVIASGVDESNIVKYELNPESNSF